MATRSEYERFITVYRYFNFGQARRHTEILVDRVTGVNYLYTGSADDGGGLTPLLGADGKPVIPPMNDTPPMPNK